MTEMVTSGSMSGGARRSDGLLGESGPERTPLAAGAAGPARHRACPRLYPIAWERFHATRYSTSSSRSPDGESPVLLSLRHDVEPPPQVLQTDGRDYHAAPAFH